MTRLIYAILVGSMLPAICVAQARVATDSGGGAQAARGTDKFFYTVPEGIQDEWEYAVPACVAASAAAELGLRNCVAFEKHQMCKSSKTVELTNILNKQKRKFMLVHHVFDSKAACAKDRQEALKGH